MLFYSFAQMIEPMSEPEAIDRVHAWFLCARRHPEGLDGGCDCAGRYAALSERERQWLHTGLSDWSCCDD